jgi:hypothetical protein
MQKDPSIWSKPASKEALERTVASLKENNIEAIVVEDEIEAKKRILEILPKGAEVLTMTSVTLDTLSVTKEINESGNYDAIRPKLNQMNRATQDLEMQKLGSAPEWAIGSVHAVTEDGKVIVASNSGSQLPGYSYGSSHVIWVVGTQKIVKDLTEGLKRIYEYDLPLEDKRAQKAYGRGSFVSKLLIFNRESKPGRIIMILINRQITSRLLKRVAL